jgi:hypothetical protein
VRRKRDRERMTRGEIRNENFLIYGAIVVIALMVGLAVFFFFPG